MIQNSNSNCKIDIKNISKKMVLFTIISIFFISGNAQEKEISEIIPDSGRAVIVVIRPTKAVGNPCSFPFGVDNQVFCVLNNGQFGYTNINPGKHELNGSRFLEGSYELTMSQDKTLNLDWDSDHSSEIMNDKEFDSGKIYYYMTKIGLGSISIYARLEEITPEEAKKLLKKCKLSPKNKTSLKKE